MSYTWEEVSAHSSESSAWVYVHDTVYDITRWMDKHPGGKQVLRLAAGRDVTDLFYSYHPFNTKQAKLVLDKYAIGKITKIEHTQFTPDTGFYDTLKKRVGEYFEKNKINHKDPIPAIQRLVGCVALGIVMFAAAHLAQSMVLRVLAAVVFGVLQALPLLLVMHDASHYALGNAPWMWGFFGKLVMDWFAGASLDSWLHQHILGHHVYTNIFGADPDLPVLKSGDIRRITDSQKWLDPYKFQHIYLPFLYMFLTIKVRITDFKDTLIGKVSGPIRISPQDWYWHFEKVLTKIFFFAWRVVLPVYVWKVPLSQVIALFLLTEFVTGAYLTYNFQVSHISPEAMFPVKKTKIDTEWAVVQVKTSVDYGHGNALVTFLTGALNYQIEHHLFPSIAQVHYPAIAPIVMATCKEFDVPYNNLPTFVDAFWCHLKHLYQMGSKASMS